MTERICRLKQLQWDRVHHAARIALDPAMPLAYRNPSDSDTLRTALRMQQALSMETPYLFPDELIAFTRTVPNLPFLYSEEEWAAIRAAHFEALHAENVSFENVNGPMVLSFGDAGEIAATDVTGAKTLMESTDEPYVSKGV